VCRFRVATGWRRVNKCHKRRPCWSVIRPVSITFSRLAPSSPDRHTLVSYWGKTLLLYSSYLPLGVSNWTVLFIIITVPHHPHHRHLEWLKLMRVQLWSICLTNHKLKTLCSMKYEYPNLMLLDLESQASSCHCKYISIIENRQRGTSCPMTWNKPTSK
jgi:hypothetical protein